MTKSNLAHTTAQTRFWHCYAVGAPIVFVTLAAGLHIADYLSFDMLFWMSIIMFGISSVIWWVWAALTIANLSIILQQTDDELIEILKEIRAIKDHINK